MASKKNNQIVNQETGEIVVVRGVSAKTMAPPKRAEVTPIEAIAGKNPPAINLRDHPELSGMEVTIMDSRFQESTLGGKKGSYVIAACYVTAPGVQAEAKDFMILMTGSENVQGRIAEAIMAAEGGSPYPISGTLRCSAGGRAWFLD